jgi:hypothetical protein
MLRLTQWERASRPGEVFRRPVTTASISFFRFPIQPLSDHLPISNPLKNPLTKNQVPASSLCNTQPTQANFSGQTVLGKAEYNSGLLQAKDGGGSDGGDFRIHGQLAP